MKQYKTIFEALVTLFATSMGVFDLGIYDSLDEDKKIIGVAFHVVFTGTNLLLLVNLIIAIMSSTYQRLSDVKIGLYSQEILEAMPSYKNNKYYGGLICMIPPINMLAYVLLPFYLGIKNKAKLEKFNKAVCMVLYFPIGLVVSAFFLAASLLMVPFAYFKVVVHKIILANR